MNLKMNKEEKELMDFNAANGILNKKYQITVPDEIKTDIFSEDQT